MPFNSVYDSGFDPSQEKRIDLNTSPWNLSNVTESLPEPLFTPDKNRLSGIGFGESKYDIITDKRSVTDESYINQRRGELQPNYQQGFNSIVGGVVSGLFTAVEDASYIGDMENNIKRLFGIENVESNFIADWMKDNKECIVTGKQIGRAHV